MKPKKKNRNKTGLPDKLKSGIENLSGQSMDYVKVHYSSDKPAKLQAHAYAQGTDIHLSAEQEKYLPHEAWHIVQKKQGRVKPTMQMKSEVNINDDAGLEKEADVMGMKAVESNTVLKGLSKIKMYNNLGIINPNSPFHLFGPSPSKGSFFLFGSGEWLNKSIAEIKVQLFWEKDIPNDFAIFYSAYPENFKNTSFKVAFSVLKNGVWKLLNDKSFMLFEENNDNTISHISTFKLIFENDFILANCSENNNEFGFKDKTRDGFIMMQLVEPNYGFGTEIYSDLVAEQAMLNKQNSFWESLKFWKKKNIPLLIPSLPYIPVVNKIDIRITYKNSMGKGN